MRLALAFLILASGVATAGTRDVSGGASCSACTFALCVGSSGYYEQCADACSADVLVRTSISEGRGPKTLVANGRKRTRLTCAGLGAPCALCESDADCNDTRNPGTRGICVEHTCKYVCPSGVVLEYP